MEDWIITIGVAAGAVALQLALPVIWQPIQKYILRLPILPEDH